ncbi:GIY-YIG nuclease family protein [Gammaproteobacteria bacterium]|nr:GIY-YIG nuclease family protein [Gammaproteobacteria bacterium]
MGKFTEEDDALLDELGVEVKVKKKASLSAREERIIAGFEEIQRFIEEHGREPAFGENRDIFERLYATRLEQIRRQSDCVELLKDQDHQDLLNESFIMESAQDDDLDDDALLGELGLNSEEAKTNITQLTHVKPRAEVSRPAEIGQRTICKDFEIFRPLFEAIQQDIKSSKRKVIAYAKDSSVEEGNVFILSGQMVYVAEVGEPFTGVDGRNENRLRVIFDNGVESNQLMHSLQKRLWDDKTSRRVTDLSMGPLFDGEPDEDDEVSGTIYVARSQSDHPLIAKNKNVVHKIGVTSKSIESRLSGAEEDPTFLFAKADLVASFELYNINPHKLETLLHKIFASARLEIEIPDRFGKSYRPQEWFCVSLDALNDAVEKLKEGSLTSYQYNTETGVLEKIDS